MWQALLAAGMSYMQQKEAREAGGGMMQIPSNLTNGGNSADFSGWTVATSGGKASSIALPQLTPMAAAVLGIGGLVAWRAMRKKS